MGAIRQRFSPSERLEIARALCIDSQSPELSAFVETIEGARSRLRADLESDGQFRKEFFESRGVPAPRGRPDGQGIAMMSLLYLCASLYTRITQNAIKNSRSDPFYRLAQICLRRADPSKFIARLKSPPWSDYSRHDLPRGLADARTLLCSVAAEALKPDGGQ